MIFKRKREQEYTYEVSAHHDISSSIGKALSRKRTNLTNSTCNLKHSLNLHLNKNWIANVIYLCVTMHPIHSFSVMLQNDNSIHAPRSRIIPPKNQERQQTRNYKTPCWWESRTWKLHATTLVVMELLVRASKINKENGSQTLTVQLQNLRTTIELTDIPLRTNQNTNGTSRPGRVLHYSIICDCWGRCLETAGRPPTSLPNFPAKQKCLHNRITDKYRIRSAQ